MNKPLNDKELFVIVLGSLFGITCYFYLLFLSPWSMLVVHISVFLAVVAVLTIIVWIVTHQHPRHLHHTIRTVKDKTRSGE